ncbi:biotin/lipoate--protein ligase family protein [Pseudorhodoplanes sp.]|uniref:biotin/lipoate--protein ligase family protein n=1 Tax=Pseudorhodoplanes sp. TaxID=1934341 RepID=UPI00391C430B
MLTDADIRLPPPFRLVTLREVGDAFAHAKQNATEQGAGTLVFVGRFDLAEFAVVLEPDEPLRIARRSFHACMAALAETLVAHAPPETEIHIGWPDAVSVNLGLVGGGRLAWPDDADEDAPPAWMVFGAMIRLVTMGETEAGLYPLSAALTDEGFGEFSAERMMESFARHLMVMLDAWQEKGFGAVSKAYLQRLAPEKEKGIRRDLDDNGDLLVRRAGKVETERRKLVPALAVPSWLDPRTGGPRL